MAMNKNERYTNLSLFKALLTLAWWKLARRCYDSRTFYSEESNKKNLFLRVVLKFA